MEHHKQLDKEMNKRLEEVDLKLKNDILRADLSKAAYENQLLHEDLSRYMYAEEQLIRRDDRIKNENKLLQESIDQYKDSETRLIRNNNRRKREYDDLKESIRVKKKIRNCGPSDLDQEIARRWKVDYDELVIEKEREFKC